MSSIASDVPPRQIIVGVDAHKHIRIDSLDLRVVGFVASCSSSPWGGVRYA